MNDALLINTKDNVVTCLRPVSNGETITAAVRLVPTWP